MKNYILISMLVSVFGMTAFATEHGKTEAAHGAKHEAKEERDNTTLFPAKLANKTVVTPPVATALEAPAFMAKVSDSAVTLKWKAVEGVTNYHIQVATDPNFKWLKADETLYPNTTFEVKELEKGKHYYWRVAAMKPENDPSYIKSPYVKSMFETTGAQ